MVRPFACLAVAVVVAFALPAAAEDKFKKEDLVGTWKLVKTKGMPLPEGMSGVVTYSKDGTALAKMDDGKNKFEIHATWSIEGNKLRIKSKKPGADKEETDVELIVTLTAKKLVTKNEKGEEDELSKVEEKK